MMSIVCAVVSACAATVAVVLALRMRRSAEREEAALPSWLERREDGRVLVRPPAPPAARRRA